MSKKKREYNGKKREREYYNTKYRITMDRRESINIMANIGLQRVRHISLCALFSNVAMNQNYIHIIAKHVMY